MKELLEIQAKLKAPKGQFNKFGNYFALKVFQLTKNKWHMDIPSKRGHHFIYIYDLNVSKPYMFDEVEDRVYQDYLDNRKEQMFNDAYKRFSTQYLLKRSNK